MGGRTIAVIGTPLNLQYPKENRFLQAHLAEKHLVISQVPVIRYQQTPNLRRIDFSLSSKTSRWPL
jgi:DNA processing protein